MKYIDAIGYINNTKKFGEKNGLSGIERLMESFGNPQDELSFVHIAGTNGKGSTSAYIAETLTESGYKTGLFTSPFIYEFNERIKIDGVAISDDEIAEIMTQIKEKIDEMEKGGFPRPTEFEVITAMAFIYFNRKKCDIVVLEVGLGGRFDATNIIKNPICSVICTIGYDHTQYLGDTISDIAKEKGGIIKQNRPVVLYPYMDADAEHALIKIAKERNAKIIKCEKESIRISKSDLSGNEFDYKNIKGIKTALSGIHQVYNAALAIETINVLKENGYNIKEEIVKKAVAQTKWPARMEEMSKEPKIIFDGAHNLDAMSAFRENVKTLAPQGRKIIILSMVKDKDYKRCIQQLNGVADVLITTTIDNPRAETAENLMKCAENFACGKYVTEDVSKALDTAISLYKKGDTIFAVGSLYMANEMKNEIGAKKSII